MNQISSSQIDPQAFAEWVHKIATINEHFSEVLHDTADIVAILDPTAAIGLYQAADTASQTVNALRCIRPPPPPAPPASAIGWIGFGLLCGLLGHTIARL